MDTQARQEIRDIKNTVEWELIRLTNLIADAGLRAGELRSLRAAEARIADAVTILSRHGMD